MFYAFSVGILLLLAVAHGQNSPEDIQNAVASGRQRYINSLAKNALFDIQSSLEKARVALSNTITVTRWQETTTITNLLAGQLNEIKRIIAYLRGLDASRCTVSSQEQFRDAVYDSGAVYETCVSQNVGNLRQIIQNLTNLEYSYKSQFVDQGVTIIQRCAMTARNNLTVATECIDKFSASFETAITNAEAIVSELESQIDQALKIVPTCSTKARTNATLCVNAIVDSIRVCVLGSGVDVNVIQFPNYTDVQTQTLDDAVVEFNRLKLALKYTQSTITLILNSLRQLYDEARQSTVSYASDVIQRRLSSESETIKNARSISGLTFVQLACINTASSDLRTITYRAATQWAECAGQLLAKIYGDAQAVDRIGTTLNDKIKSDGLAAYVKCVTQNSGNTTTTAECIRSQSSTIEDYMNSLMPQLSVKIQSSETQANALAQCRAMSEAYTTAESTRIINTLRRSIPQLYN